MESRWQLVGMEVLGGELSRKEKALMDMDNSVVVAEGRYYKDDKW